MKQVASAAESRPTMEFAVPCFQQGLSIDDQSTNEIYKNFNFDNKMTNNFTESKYEGQTDLNTCLRINENSVCKVDRDSEASTNSNTSTKSSNSNNEESDVSNVSYKTATSERPRLSEIEIYEHITYLTEMGADLKLHSENDTTERNEINNGAPISKNVERNQLVTNENRASSGSDVSLRLIHNQRLGLETQDAMVKGDMQLSITAKESIDMKKITSQTNISLNNSTVTFVINQSNEGNKNVNK
ncbi:unnamed protein product [Mytilus coruscus]|uniref:Uncharacterized protein n=1 Tax=Mytilus coruscus TaxID=42192 RepID=A0A6J8CTB1_MYTCO|nr:unnamed protein product [Mytilus coruscus]